MNLLRKEKESKMSNLVALKGMDRPGRGKLAAWQCEHLIEISHDSIASYNQPNRALMLPRTLIKPHEPLE